MIHAALQLAHPGVCAALLLLLTINGQTPKPAVPFTTPLSRAEMTDKQAVVDDVGRHVRHRPAARPRAESRRLLHQARAATARYDGTIFHRVVRLGIIQGGDPLSKDPAKAKQYGTGGLGVLKAELSGEKHTRGAVSAVLQPGKPDSGGAQFFVCVTDQPALDGKYTIFGRVSEGLDVVQKISEVGRRRTWRAGRAGRDSPRHHSRHAAARTRTIRERVARRARGAPRDPRDVRWVRSPSSSFRTRRPRHVRNFLRLAAARRLRRHVVSSRRERVRDPDRLAELTRTADRKATEGGPVAATRVQRHEARERHPVDGAW